ncbi:unnamed protein product [Adineta steineri]|uniref:Uncharacterized protein n=1 Tax=Adineta steineri TaxID=433720 RepID=A0A818V464_9BILA|nr:unnamed protein product [Adineta steineri]CAF3706935.1 unnamed protein product [Adineta steineri]
MSSSSLTKSMSESSSSLSREPCIRCQEQPYDVVCTCGDKYDFTCVQLHGEEIRMEFEFYQNEVAQRLLEVEQIVEDKNPTNARTIVENWRRKRMTDIDDIANNILSQIDKREEAYSNVASFRVQFDSLSQNIKRIVHEQVHSIITLQQQVREKSDQLEILPELLHDDINLDSELQSKLNPNIINQSLITQEIEPMTSSASSKIYENEPVISSNSPINILTNTKQFDSDPMTTSNTNMAMSTVEINRDSMTISNMNMLTNTESIPNTDVVRNPESTMTISDPTVNIEPETDLTNTREISHSIYDSSVNDEFEAGYTANIQRRNVIIIRTENDKFVGTVCCHDNQLLYNDYNHHSRDFRLTFIRDLAQPGIRQYIDWTQPETTINGGDSNWIQDIVYSSKLQGYLILNRARLRLLYDDTFMLDEFHEFPDRSMKRVTCNNEYIYLISACNATSPNGDEIIIMTYDKQEKICKTFRDIAISPKNRTTTESIGGEISDLAISTGGLIMVSYRLESRHEVGVFIYNVTNNGSNWSPVQQFVLDRCWHNDLSYTPRIEWCEKLNVFILIEYISGHLIMLDENKQVKGECRFAQIQNRNESPLNISISNNNWLCARYESSITIHQLQNTRL